MRPRLLTIILTLNLLAFNQMAFAYDQNAQQQINQIQQQLQQQFPQHSQQQPMMAQPSDPDAQQQIQMIQNELQQFSPQYSLQQPAMQMQQQQAPIVQGQISTSTMVPANRQMSNFAPSNYQQQTLPMLNSATMVGAPKGVDILDESLQYHNMNGMQSINQMGMQQHQCGMNQTCNAHASCGHVHNTCPHMTCQHATACGGHDNCQGHSQMNASAAADSQMTTRAIGAIGAAALFGHFINNGGVGGAMRSMGLDNSRHIRGASIGGY